MAIKIPNAHKNISKFSRRSKICHLATLISVGRKGVYETRSRALPFLCHAMSFYAAMQGCQIILVQHKNRNNIPKRKIIYQLAIKIDHMAVK
jgi:hypothetical protein